MKFSYDYKAFPINLHFFNIVGVCPKHFILTWKKHFQGEKVQDTDKVHKKGHKKFFHFTYSNVYKNSILLFHFLILCNVSQIFHVCILLFKNKLKVQHESGTSQLCTIMLHFYVELFSRKVFSNCFQYRIYMISRWKLTFLSVNHFRLTGRCKIK